jgi:hypothetical protein
LLKIERNLSNLIIQYVKCNGEDFFLNRFIYINEIISINSNFEYNHIKLKHQISIKDEITSFSYILREKKNLIKI